MDTSVDAGSVEKAYKYEALEKKAAEILGWIKVPASCYDGGTETWVQEKGNAVVGSCRRYSPLDELVRRAAKKTQHA